MILGKNIVPTFYEIILDYNNYNILIFFLETLFFRSNLVVKLWTHTYVHFIVIIDD